MRPSVGFIIPAYNASATLERTLESLRAQTSPSWTAIVVDDGSADGTAALAAGLAAAEPRILLLRTTNRGPSAARNAGLRATMTDYVTFLDADDTVGRRYVERMTARLERSPDAAGVCCGSERKSQDGRVMSRSLPSSLTTDPRSACRPGVPAPIHALLIRRALVASLGGFDEDLKAFEDWDLWLRIVHSGAEIAVLPATLVSYWCRPGQGSRNGLTMLSGHAVVLERSRALAGKEGASPEAQALSRLSAVLWSGGVALGAGDDARLLAAGAALLTLPPYDAGGLAVVLLHGLAVGSQCRLEDLLGRWEAWASPLVAFLERVEGAAGCAGLAYLLLKSAEREAVRRAPLRQTTTLGRTLAMTRREAVRPSGWVAREACDSVVVKLWGARIAEAAVIGGAFSVRELGAATLDQSLDQLWGSRWAGPVERGLRLSFKAARRLRRGGLHREAGREGSVRRVSRPSPIQQARRAEIVGEERAVGVAAVGARAKPSTGAPRTPEPYGGEQHDMAPLWDAFFARPDPWNYDSAYEQLKYDRTLDMVPKAPIARALELACAEGRFTERLAPKVERLQVFDISSVALQRADERCAAFSNVDYDVRDVFNADIGTGWSLIVCSEVLYYLHDRERLAPLARRIGSALAPGGWFVHCHARALVDDPGRTGFDWAVPFGGDAVAAAFEAVPGLRRVRSLHTALYRIDVFQRLDQGLAPVDDTLPLTCALEPGVARQVVWNGLVVARDVLQHTPASRTPVLMYHRVAEVGPSDLAPFRVTPAEFEGQLNFLRRRGYYSVSLEQWRAATRGHRLLGRPLFITFDDAYVDFIEFAWPLLQRYGFSAHIFVPTDKVGRTADWDAHYGAPARLMGWSDIAALGGEGVTFGSHLASHPWAPTLPSEVLFREAVRSKAALEVALGSEITSIAPPYGATNARVASVLRQSGYREGFLAGGGAAASGRLGLSIPRIDVVGGAGLKAFAASLGPAVEPPEAADAPVGVAGVVLA